MFNDDADAADDDDNDDDDDGRIYFNGVSPRTAMTHNSNSGVT